MPDSGSRKKKRVIISVNALTSTAASYATSKRPHALSPQKFEIEMKKFQLNQNFLNLAEARKPNFALMNKLAYLILSFFFLLTVTTHTVIAQRPHTSAPQLLKHGNATQLIVAGKPCVVFWGETGNSSASNMQYMQPIWDKIRLLNCNTVLAPVYGELMEPEKGQFNFSLVDSLVPDERKHDMKVGLLRFGGCKNSMSCYIPAWVKKDCKTYPRAYDHGRFPQEILTPFSENNRKADMTVFVALMKHIRGIDEKDQTVIMIQVENEIGMLPAARDYHPIATKAFQQPVPQPLVQYPQKNKSKISPTLRSVWKKNGSKTNGTWEGVFGKELATDEYFIAWHFADFTKKITEAGKNAYPLPMCVHAALNRRNAKRGEYPPSAVMEYTSFCYTNTNRITAPRFGKQDEFECI